MLERQRAIDQPLGLRGSEHRRHQLATFRRELILRHPVVDRPQHRSGVLRQLPLVGERHFQERATFTAPSAAATTGLLESDLPP